MCVAGTVAFDTVTGKLETTPFVEPEGFEVAGGEDLS